MSRRQKAVGSGQWAVGSGQWAVGSGQLAEGSRQRAVGRRQLADNLKEMLCSLCEYEMETLNIGRRACLDKGELSLYMTNRTGRLGLIRLALRALLRGLRQEKDFLALSTREIWIGTKHKRLRVALDGEVAIIEPPLHYRVQPGRCAS